MRCQHWQRGFAWRIEGKRRVGRERMHINITACCMWALQKNPIQLLAQSGSSSQRCTLTPDCIQGILLQISPWAGQFSGPLRGAESPPGTFVVQKQNLCPGSPFDQRRRTSPPYWSGHYPRGILPLESKRAKGRGQSYFNILQCNIQIRTRQSKPKGCAVSYTPIWFEPT